MVVVGDFRSQTELRKSKRQRFHQKAMIQVTGLPPRACSISDISSTGAKVTLESDEDVPEQFTLLISANGAIQRHCRKVWRDGLIVGVEFTKDAPPPPAAGKLA